jgi:hypothetical protein
MAGHLYGCNLFAISHRCGWSRLALYSRFPWLPAVSLVADFGIVFGGLKAVLDMTKTANDLRKYDLEIRKLNFEIEELQLKLEEKRKTAEAANKYIAPATWNDVKEYAVRARDVLIAGDLLVRYAQSRTSKTPWTIALLSSGIALALSIGGLTFNEVSSFGSQFLFRCEQDGGALLIRPHQTIAFLPNVSVEQEPLLAELFVFGAGKKVISYVELRRLPEQGGLKKFPGFFVSNDSKFWNALYPRRIRLYTFDAEFHVEVTGSNHFDRVCTSYSEDQWFFNHQRPF